MSASGGRAANRAAPQKGRWKPTAALVLTITRDTSAPTVFVLSVHTLVNDATVKAAQPAVATHDEAQAETEVTTEDDRSADVRFQPRCIDAFDSTGSGSSANDAGWTLLAHPRAVFR